MVRELRREAGFGAFEKESKERRKGKGVRDKVSEVDTRCDNGLRTLS